MNKALILSIMCLFSISGATAEDAAAPQPDSLENRDAIPRARVLAQDADHDGYVSREEAATDARLAREFDRRDKNSDDRLSEDELTQRASTPQLNIPLPGTEDVTGQKKFLGVTIKPASAPEGGLGIGP